MKRHLLRNPFGAHHTEFSFEDRVQAAIESSLRAGRVVGVIQFQVMAPLDKAGPVSAEADLEATNKLADQFRASLRATDCVVVNSPGEVVAFVSQLCGLSDLGMIARRLSRAAFEAAMNRGAWARLDPGIAMYPVDGYFIDDLLAAARGHRANARINIDAQGPLAPRLRLASSR